MQEGIQLIIVESKGVEYYLKQINLFKILKFFNFIIPEK